MQFNRFGMWGTHVAYYLNPFGKPLSEITSSDLSALSEVREGWYIEYKREVPPAKSIAKSVTAFANTYGGFLFYGISEVPEKNGTFTFEGIPISNSSLFEARIRQAVADSTNPPPYFKCRALSGPNSNIGLKEDHCIFVIEVPQSSNTPHIHSDGRIYRRIADSSDPKHETDRHIFDSLSQRNRERRNKFLSIVEATPRLSPGETNSSFVELFLFPKFWPDTYPPKTIQFSEFAECMKPPNPDFGGITFDNIFACPDGFIARQSMNNPDDRLLFTWRYYLDGVSHITLPLSSAFLDSGTPERFFEAYENGRHFIKKCRAIKCENRIVVDLNMAYSVTWGIFRTHEKLCQLTGTEFEFNLKLRTHGIWRRTPFLDTTSYRNYIDRFGIPVVQNNELSCPPDSQSFALPSAEGDIEDWTVFKTDIAFAGICTTFGIPYDLIWDDGETIDELHKIGTRAMNAQDIRNFSK